VDLQRDKARLFEYLRGQIKDKRVLEAMSRVPREYFIPEDLSQYAYDDRPISIGHGQTISQPYIVALMTQALELTGNEKVLEVGTGSGYQTAILAELANSVVSVERIPGLIASAEKILEELGYKNITVHLAGNKLGWEPDSPYDAIMVTAAAPNLSDILFNQLAMEGRLIIPVGSRWEQELLLLKKEKTGKHIDNLGFCRFVPLIGEDAWSD
jgi:protein-L-isoaspartate(D-aspartate) O-methyltransferase